MTGVNAGGGLLGRGRPGARGQYDQCRRDHANGGDVSVSHLGVQDDPRQEHGHGSRPGQQALNGEQRQLAQRQ